MVAGWSVEPGTTIRDGVTTCLEDETKSEALNIVDERYIYICGVCIYACKGEARNKKQNPKLTRSTLIIRGRRHHDRVARRC